MRREVSVEETRYDFTVDSRGLLYCESREGEVRDKENRLKQKRGNVNIDCYITVQMNEYHRRKGGLTFIRGTSVP